VDDVKRYLREFLRIEDNIIVNDYYTSAITCYNVEQPFITNSDEITRRKMERNSIKDNTKLLNITSSNKCGYC